MLAFPWDNYAKYKYQYAQDYMNGGGSKLNDAKQNMTADELN